MCVVCTNNSAFISQHLARSNFCGLKFEEGVPKQTPSRFLSVRALAKAKPSPFICLAQRWINEWIGLPKTHKSLNRMNQSRWSCVLSLHLIYIPLLLFVIILMVVMRFLFFLFFYIAQWFLRTLLQNATEKTFLISPSLCLCVCVCEFCLVFLLCPSDRFY